MNLAYAQVERFAQSQQAVYARFVDVIGPVEKRYYQRRKTPPAVAGLLVDTQWRWPMHQLVPMILALLLQTRMNELPPKEGDLTTSRVINDVLESAGNQEAMTDPQFARWSRTAASQSAIYRLLALRSSA